MTCENLVKMDFALIQWNIQPCLNEKAFNRVKFMFGGNNAH